jgi:hypothetical protein
MEPGFLSRLAHIDSPLFTGVAKDVYSSFMGSIRYVALCMRPDVSTALSILGSANPTEVHNKVVR